MRNITRLVSLSIAVAALSFGATAAHAQSASAQQQAEDDYTKGDTAYNLGRYDEAVDWFTKAYEAWPQPEFLYNIAQSYRLGGNCKQALHFYKRFKSLKEKDTDNPLSKKKAKEIDDFIKDLQDCADKADNISGQPPDGVDHPGTGDTTTTGGNTTTTGDHDTTTTGGHDTTTTGGHDTTTTGGHDTTTTGGNTTTTGGDTTTTTTAANTDTATDTDTDTDTDDDQLTTVKKTTPPKLLSARADGGIALIGAGSLKVPVQPAFGITGGYPLAAGPVQLDLGASFGFSPVPYKDPSQMTHNASMVSLLADVGATYPVNDKIGARVDAGIGVLAFSGLVQGNPFTLGGASTTGALGMLNVRGGIAADYAINSNLLVTVTPFAFAFSPTGGASKNMAIDALTQMQFMVGLGYKM